MFGKRPSEYLRFQKTWLIVIAAVGLARLVLSLAGMPHLTIGIVAPVLIWWAVASLVLLVTKKVARRPAAA